MVIDGKECHAQTQILNDGFIRHVPILYPDGAPVPSYVCICGADDEFECDCGAWNREIDDED